MFLKKDKNKVVKSEKKFSLKNIDLGKLLGFEKEYEYDYIFPQELFDSDPPDFKVTEELRENIKANPKIALGCDARIRMGKFYTDEEYEEYRKKSLERKLP